MICIIRGVSLSKNLVEFRRFRAAKLCEAFFLIFK